MANLADERQRWPRFVSAATGSGFVSVHAVPMRAAGIVLGALGLFGTTAGELTDADRLVAQTLAHIACVAILQEHAPTADTVQPQLSVALTNRIVVEQAKGYLREHFDISVEDAFRLLRRHARTHSDHLTEISRRLINEPTARHAILTTIKSTTAPPP